MYTHNYTADNELMEAWEDMLADARIQTNLFIWSNAPQSIIDESIEWEWTIWGICPTC